MAKTYTAIFLPILEGACHEATNHRRVPRPRWLRPNEPPRRGCDAIHLRLYERYSSVARRGIPKRSTGLATCRRLHEQSLLPLVGDSYAPPTRRRKLHADETG